MFDKNPYFKTIKHAICSNGTTEGSEFKAFKLDNADGIAEAIGFKASMLNKVDYFLSRNHFVQLIELSDLAECVKGCHAYIESEKQKVLAENREISKREENKIIKAAWKETTNEFSKKWSGSIAVIERLYRKTQESGEADPNYALLIVCKNHTEARMLDSLKNQLSGMMGRVEVCNTKTLGSFLKS